LALNLAELLSIARGEIGAENGRNGVARRNVTPPVTPKKPGVTPVTCVTPQNCEFGKDVFGGVAEGVTPALRRPLFDPEALQAEADRCNRVSAAANVHRCDCGAVGVIGVGWFLKEPSRARWYCSPCFKRLPLNERA
jgi:hypothetical protein